MQILVQRGAERKIALTSDAYALIFNAVKNGDHSKPLCAIELLPKSRVGVSFQKMTSHEVHGFIGLIELEGLIFICTITGKTKVAQPVPKEAVNKIFAVDFFCLNDSRWDFVELDSNGYPVTSEDDYRGSGGSTPGSMGDQSPSVPGHPCHELRKLLSNGSFYYSSNFDLTSILQKRGMSAHSLSFDNYQEEYMWNSFLMQETITFRNHLDDTARRILDDEGFLTTVIRGFAETFVTYIKQLKVSLTVISKQSWKRAGTRYNARGVDDEANVANFVETELIMYSREYCYAFTQIRGSIPIFWEQDTALINPKVQITRSLEATQSVFDDHFTRLVDKYGPVHVVNLLSTKSNEIELSRRYKQHVAKSKAHKLNKDIFFTEFDFHKETSQEGFAAAARIKPLVTQFLLESGYFSYDVRDHKVLSEQHGIFRTNCLDCLDRTNLVQQFLSRYAFALFLNDFHLMSTTQGTAFTDSDLFIKHNTLWADHGDQVSQIYTGTNALKSSFSRKGKMSFAGVLSDATKSVSRMYINNFMDKNKQINIDTLLGRLSNQRVVALYDPINEYVTSELNKSSSQFTTSSTINIFVGTYNVNGLTRKTDLSKWLFPIGDKFKPDVVVLGMQEIIELSAGSILNADYSKSSFWQGIVNDCLNQYNDKYLLLRAEQMSSLLILFLVKSDKVKNVKEVEGSSKKTGLGGMTGNKGAVSIRFTYGSTSFCFVNAHLAAGVNNVDERRNDYDSINKGISFTRSRQISHHDAIFWHGDLNYRLALPNEEVRRELNAASGDRFPENLLLHDQLTQEINAGVVFKGFKEPTVKFPPTYKYDHGTNNYDTSEKARTPSWTDRIVYKGENLRPLAYSDAQLTASDHKPVYAAYRAQVNYVDEAIKGDLTKKLYLEYKKAHPESSNEASLALVDVNYEENIRKPRTTDPGANEWSAVNLLDYNENQSRVKSPSPSPSSSSSSDLASVQSVPLQPVRKEMPVTSLSSASLGRTRIPPSPPPAPRTTSTQSLQASFAANSSRDVRTTEATKNSSIIPPPPPSRKTVFPPGYNSSILTPKSSSANGSRITSPVQSLPITPSASESNGNKETNNNVPPVASKVDEEQPDEKTGAKVPPPRPSKKPELNNLTMESWKPLTPR
ncbi:LAME_0H12926g1_1 [Lachancea meyersii CBS 8951]|uniref:phosphoinositide 5-phosphatase n=1 Tax=Lachancea meyersii CBS 8951 TaxID=1266667 RepID=A0A1G4KGS4_9SACH|nr:LAME_0H12926g1_1 [Lachancea meyersii CBS 8951]